MSLNGWRETQLAKERLKALRLERKKQNARSLLDTCESRIRAVRDPAIARQAARDLKKVQGELKDAAGRIEQTPDRALKDIRATQKRLAQVIAGAEATVNQWNKQQAQSRARIAELTARTEAEQSAARNGATQEYSKVEQAMERANALHLEGRFKEALAACKEAEASLEQAGEAAFDETVRREVVRGLLTTLTDMGFVVDGPTLQKDPADGGVVTLKGRLPSGRLARFEVHLDGRMNFDMDGYEERSCGKELERIEQTLQERFGVQLGPAQVTWKNPDRISKGSRNLPGGGCRANTR